MSFILKALRKVEKEKAARDQGRVDISSAVLSQDVSRKSAGRKAGMLMGFSFILLALLCAGLYFALKSPVPPATHPKLDSNAQVKSVPPSPEAKVPVSEAKVEPLPRVVVQDNKPVADSEAPKKPLPPPEAGNMHEKGKGRAKGMEGEIESSPEPSSDKDTFTVAAPSSMTVNGIALQDDPAKSIAVVNGQIVKKGMNVGDAVVDRIFINKVRFRGNGGVFEVYLAR